MKPAKISIIFFTISSLLFSHTSFVPDDIFPSSTAVSKPYQPEDVERTAAVVQPEKSTEGSISAAFQPFYHVDLSLRRPIGRHIHRSIDPNFLRPFRHGCRGHRHGPRPRSPLSSSPSPLSSSPTLASSLTTSSRPPPQSPSRTSWRMLSGRLPSSIRRNPPRDPSPPPSSPSTTSTSPSDVRSAATSTARLTPTSCAPSATAVEATATAHGQDLHHLLRHLLPPPLPR